MELAHRNVDRLAKMINNLLDLSRLESGAARLSRRELDLRSLAEEVVQGLRLADTKGVALETDFPQTLPLVQADPEMIAQVITNLTDNALRFARSRVTVRLRSDEGSVRVEIIDDGPGIPAEKIDALFGKFVQLERRSGEGYKGTGLGLAICKEIMRLHGSSIEVSSVVGAGTQFSFRLPSKEERHAKASQTNPQDRDG